MAVVEYRGSGDVIIGDSIICVFMLADCCCRCCSGDEVAGTGDGSSDWPCDALRSAAAICDAIGDAGSSAMGLGGCVRGGLGAPPANADCIMDMDGWGYSCWCGATIGFGKFGGTKPLGYTGIWGCMPIGMETGAFIWRYCCGT